MKYYFVILQIILISSIKTVTSQEARTIRITENEIAPDEQLHPNNGKLPLLPDFEEGRKESLDMKSEPEEHFKTTWYPTTRCTASGKGGGDNEKQKYENNDGREVTVDEKSNIGDADHYIDDQKKK